MKHYITFRVVYLNQNYNDQPLYFHSQFINAKIISQLIHKHIITKNCLLLLAMNTIYIKLI